MPTNVISTLNFYRSAFALSVVVILTACSMNGAPSLPGAQFAGARSAPKASPIQHVVIVVQENRSFNDFFAKYPGADGTTTGMIAADSTCGITQTRSIPLREVNLIIYPQDLNHRYQSYAAEYDNGKMDGFDKAQFGNGKPECKYPYQYTKPAQIKPYWDMAKQYTLAEHMYSTQGGSSFTAHQNLIRGSTQISDTEALVNDPSTSPWGCDDQQGATTSLISKDDVLKAGQGPFPCTKNFPSSYSYDTLRDLLDAKSVSWKYYVPPMKINFGSLMNAFDVIAAVRYGSEWTTNISSPQTNIFKDIAGSSGGSLPAVSWVIPDEPDSDHPGEGVDNGPSWVASVVNAIGESSYWNSTAIVIVWDEWGGLYDNKPPKQLGYGSLGFRVPTIIVSPYAKAGYISKTDYEFGSILRYIEDNFNLGRLHTTDVRAKSIIDCFDYSQNPIQFKPIQSSKSKASFLHRPPSYLPNDDY